MSGACLSASAAAASAKHRAASILDRQNPPEEVNAIIEVPISGEPIKYEMDKKTDARSRQRSLYAPTALSGTRSPRMATFWLPTPGQHSRRRHRGAADRRA
jgi:hypothetical protein